MVVGDLTNSLGIVENLNRIQNSKKLEDIVENTVDFLKEFDLDVELWSVNEFKHNLVLKYPKNEYKEIHISPENGSVAKVVYFDDLYLTPENSHNVAEELNDGLRNDSYFYLVPLKSEYDGYSELEGVLAVGSHNEIDKDTRELVKLVSNTFSNAVFRNKLLEKYENIINKTNSLLMLYTDVIRNNSVEALLSYERLKRDKNIFNPHFKMIHDSLLNIDHFIKKVASFLYVQKDYSTKDAFYLKDLFDDSYKPYSLDFLVSDNSVVVENRAALHKIIDSLIKDSYANSNETPKVIVLDNPYEYRIIVRTYNKTIPVEMFDSFFEPRSVQEYNKGNAFYALTAYLLTKMIGSDIWLNSPKDKNYYEVNFNIKKSF